MQRMDGIGLLAAVMLIFFAVIRDAAEIED
jgi:hypothetical protein